MEPGRWEDVCAALAFEEEGEPKGEDSATRREERFNGALLVENCQLSVIAYDRAV